MFGLLGPWWNNWADSHAILLEVANDAGQTMVKLDGKNISVETVADIAQ